MGKQDKENSLTQWDNGRSTTWHLKMKLPTSIENGSSEVQDEISDQGSNQLWREGCMPDSGQLELAERSATDHLLRRT